MGSRNICSNELASDGQCKEKLICVARFREMLLDYVLNLTTSRQVTPTIEPCGPPNHGQEQLANDV